MTAVYLSKLNDQQRRAVEHGCDNLNEASALLIIAGAGSGKTDTLANRVAHLIVCGVDPRRILLLTFSRRAAVELQRRAERITAEALGGKGGLMANACTGRGPFMPLARGYSASTRSISGSIASSPSMIARTLPVS
jgi:DNA helicase-2/ATP-dependent DNA helicase PcrA